jgi:hypothetical protein
LGGHESGDSGRHLSANEAGCAFFRSGIVCRRGGGDPVGWEKEPFTKRIARPEGPVDTLGQRKFLGYIVRVYYKDQLQAVQSQNKLLNLFPPPFTAPTQ